jgi:hypothetical protein
MTNVLQRPLYVTVFPNASANRKSEEQITPEELAKRIRRTTAPTKSELPWLKLALFGGTRTPLRPRADGSAGMTGGSLRHDANVLEVSGVEGDYDAGAVLFDDAVERLEKAGVACIVYTSPSYREDAPRWRVLCPLLQPVAPQKRRHLVGRLNGLFGNIFARESFTLSQAYYFGSVRLNPLHRVALVDGEAIDAHDELDEIWIGPAGGASVGDPVGVGGGEDRVDAELVRRIVTGDGFHVELTALAGRYLARGMTSHAAAAVLRGLMLSHPEAARDERWRTRFQSIGNLASSAEQKFRGDAEGRRAIARLTARMTRQRAPVEQIRAAAFAEADRQGLPHSVAQEIALWVAQRERTKAGGAHVA